MPDHAASTEKKPLEYSTLCMILWVFFLKTKTNFGVNTVREIRAKWKPHSHHLRHKQGGALSPDDDFIVAKIM